MAPPPPKRKLIDLVKGDAEVQPDPTQSPSPSTGAKQGVRPTVRDADQDEDPDFMSDAYLNTTASATSAPARKARRRLSLDSIPQEPIDEETQRSLGLSKNLMDAGKEGDSPGQDNKAMRMMMLMGYEPGKALGVDRREEEEERGRPSEGNEAALHEEGPQAELDAAAAFSLSGPPTTKNPAPHLLEPLLPNTSRLGSGASARRGIGSLSTLISRAAHSHAEAQARQAQQSTQLQDYRARSALLAKETHERKLLERGRRTCWELDLREAAEREEGMEEEKETEGEYSPLWLDKRWFATKSEDLPAEVALLVERAVGDELVDNGEGKLDEAERGQEKTPSSDTEGDGRPPAQLLTRRVQTRQFLSLPVSTRLAITLGHLRTRHRYCLFCGVQYDSQDDMQASCPGEEEEDHD